MKEEQRYLNYEAGYDLKTSVQDSIIEIAKIPFGDLLNNQRPELLIINTIDKIVKEKLVLLGWTPPGEKLNDALKAIIKSRDIEIQRLREENERLRVLPANDTGILYQCPYDESCKCKMDMPCFGCESWAKALSDSKEEGDEEINKLS